MFEKSFYFKNSDVLLMDPCYSRMYDFDEDTELYCSDLVIDVLDDGYYYVIKGRYEDVMERLDEMEGMPRNFSMGELTVDSGRIGVYDYHKAIEEQPDLKKQIENKDIIAAVIRNFSGTITSITDEDYVVHVVGKSDDGEHDFTVVSL